MDGVFQFLPSPNVPIDMKFSHSRFALIGLSLALGFPALAKEEKPAAPAVGKPDLRQASAKVDALISKAYKEHKITPNEPVSDEIFLRRAYLDIAGRIPTIEEAEEFQSSSYDRKREQLVESLMQSEAYVSHFYNFWADVLRINSGLGTGASQAEAAYQLWIKEGLKNNTPYNQMVSELVTAKGYIWDNGAVGYYQRDRGMPLDNMSNTVRIFLGTRLECAQCHNHPFDKWTQMDYYQMAAFSYGMDANRYETGNRTALQKYIENERKSRYVKAVGREDLPQLRDEKTLEKYIGQKNFDKVLARYKMGEDEFRTAVKRGIEAYNSFNGEAKEMGYATQELYRQIRYINVSEQEKTLKLPHDYKYDNAKPFDPVKPGTMFGTKIDPEHVTDSMIEAYAGWMTSKDNPTFTRVIANRLWKKVFGMGIFEPIDELTDNTVISNPELLTYLEGLMKDLNYDMKSYLQVLYNTKTYQRRADDKEIVLGEPYYFPGPLLRRMSAEQIWDSIVALALPEADRYRPRLKGQLTAVERIKRMYDALEKRSPEDYIAMTKELGKALAENLPKQDEMRKEVYKAREEQNNELYQKLRKELSALQSSANKLVADIGFKHTGEKVDAGELLAAVGMSEMAMSMGATDDGSEKPQLANAVLTALPKPKFPDMPAGLDKDQKRAWAQEQKQDYASYTQLIAGMARAAELESPAPRGHFLREFGQSDREVIENAADAASVPQALNLLNGPMVEALTNKYAVFGSRIAKAGDIEEKSRMIFQAMLTRQPTAGELALIKDEVAARGDRAYDGIVWSLLNTRQFLFVQ